ncbi:MAG TPA: tetratricopeptide repeat protein [Planktothrix sp.]
MKRLKAQVALYLGALITLLLLASITNYPAPAQGDYPAGQMQQAQDAGFVSRSQQAGDMLENARRMAHAGNFTGAKALYERCVRLDPNTESAMVHNNLASTLESLGEAAAATPEYEKALQFDPNLALARKNLASNKINVLTDRAKQLMAQLRYDDAMKVYAEIVALDPNRAMSYNNLGTAYHAKSQLDEAIEQYKKALQINPDMDLATINMARSYYNEGNFPEAKRYFSKYLHDHGDGKDANEARSTLVTIAARGGGDQTDNPQGPDYFRSATARGTLRWPPGQPITVSIDSGEGVPGYQPSFRQALIDALNQWTHATDNRLTWILVPPAAMAEIDCHWTANNGGFTLHGSNPDEQGEVSTYDTITRGDQKYIKHTTVLISTLNAKSNKYITDAEASDVCLHEVGHALGLVGHSPNFHDIMFFVTNPGGGSVLRSLTGRDIATINRLYDGYPVQK